MENPRKARVVERHFLNLPGFHAGAYVRAYVQDTSEVEVRPPTPQRPAWVPVPRLELEIADCVRRIDLDFEIGRAEDRMNSFHKIDVLIETLVAFRAGMAEEAALRRRRLSDLDRVGNVDHVPPASRLLA